MIKPLNKCCIHHFQAIRSIDNDKINASLDDLRELMMDEAMNYFENDEPTPKALIVEDWIDLLLD
jgi:hypothetical protein